MGLLLNEYILNEYVLHFIIKSFHFNLFIKTYNIIKCMKTPLLFLIEYLKWVFLNQYFLV